MDPPSSVDYSRHRLPTQSVAAALATQLDHDYESFTTGSEALDKSWGGNGLERGKLVEICGAPGAGKTTIALQLVADAVSKGEQVCWIDTLSQCAVSRLETLLGEKDIEHMSSSILRYQVISLAHLFALIAHMTIDPSLTTSLVVVDNISLLFAKEFPPASENAASQIMSNKTATNREGFEKQPERRTRLIADIASRLQRLSASRMVATIVLNQLATRSVIGGGPLELAPFVNSANYTWSHAFHHRVLLLRKHVPRTDLETAKRHLRFVFILKSSGIAIQSTNLSRPDQFFVIKVTKNGVEDEEHMFGAMTGAISMAESFAASGHNSEEHYYEEFSDNEYGVDGTELAARAPAEGNLKRKRSTTTIGSSESSEVCKIAKENARSVATEDGEHTNNDEDDYSSDTVDLVKLPEALTKSGTGTFPQVREAEMLGSQEGAHMEVQTNEPEIPQKFGRTIVPDSDGESDDDVFF
ncbi:hypothetical protein H072_7187 [Dactylellina haptotyla CBS 200.50]|uniref:RecA family profile 1 domain-containing protein n=1 Tax=Dactylellina haptotyla (strain CBS 200.50) TaxID=1284197 RepID=S8BUR6_DACHA|nr:hypothetical protein H072_7187 [Dactylellina haptotyla CBS 200.50]